MRRAGSQSKEESASPSGGFPLGLALFFRDPLASDRTGPHTGLSFTPHIRGKRSNVLRAAQSRFFFYSPCSEKQFGHPNYFSKPYHSTRQVKSVLTEAPV